MHLITRCILQRMQGAPRQPSDSSVIGSRFWSQPPLAITLQRYHQLVHRPHHIGCNSLRTEAGFVEQMPIKVKVQVTNVLIVGFLLEEETPSLILDDCSGHLAGFSVVIFNITIPNWLSGSGCEEGTPPRLILGNCWGHTARPDHDYEEKTLQFNVTAWNLSVACLPGQMDHYRLPRDWGTDGNFSNTGLCSEGTWLLSRGAVFTSRCSCFSKSSYYQGGVAQILGLSGSRNMVAAFQILPRYSDSKHTHTYYTPLGNLETNMLLRIVWLYGIIR